MGVHPERQNLGDNLQRMARFGRQQIGLRQPVQGLCPDGAVSDGMNRVLHRDFSLPSAGAPHSACAAPGGCLQTDVRLHGERPPLWHRNMTCVFK